MGDPVVKLSGDFEEVDKGVSWRAWRGPGGSAIRIDWTRQGICRLIHVGHAHGDYPSLYLPYVKTTLAYTGRLTWFIDYWDSGNYDTKYRIDMVAWGRANLDKIDNLHVLARTPMIRMGVSVANLAMGNIFTLHSARAPFDIAAKNAGFPLNPTIPPQK